MPDRPPLTVEQQALLDELSAKMQEVLAPYVESVASFHAAIMMRPQPELITIQIAIPAGVTEAELDAAVERGMARQKRAWQRK